MRLHYFALLSVLGAHAEISQPQRNSIDQITAAKGAYTASEDVYRVTFPRTDVKVSIEGRAMHPFLGLTSWAAFTPTASGPLMVMGDLVLFEDEVNPVLTTAIQHGLEVTALHNHFFFEQPRVMFMHIAGTGSAEMLSTAVRKALDKVKEIRAANPQPSATFPGASVPDASSIPAPAIDKILGVTGQSNSGMYKALIGRTATMHGKSVGNQMGVNTWAAFAGTEQAALVDGDFAMTTAELQPVLKALTAAGINIVAIHNHMTHEEPQYVFLHYWAKGNALTLARSLKTALDAQQAKTQAAAIVFVCEHGAAKSVIATAFFNQLASERGLPHRATTRGTDLDPVFAPKVIAGLTTQGVTPPTGLPQILTANDLTGAQRLITFDVNPPVGLPAIHRTEWNGTPSPSVNFEAASKDIEQRVRKLIDELAAHSH